MPDAFTPHLPILIDIYLCSGLDDTGNILYRFLAGKEAFRLLHNDIENFFIVIRGAVHSVDELANLIYLRLRKRLQNNLFPIDVPDVVIVLFLAPVIHPISALSGLLRSVQKSGFQHRHLIDFPAVLILRRQKPPDKLPGALHMLCFGRENKGVTARAQG